MHSCKPFVEGDYIKTLEGLTMRACWLADRCSSVRDFPPLMKQIRENLFAIVRLRGSSDVVLEAEEITRIEGLKQEYEARMMK